MALILKPDGTAAVEEPKATNTTAGAVTDSGESVKDTAAATQKTKTEVPEAATAGMDFKTVQQNLNTTYDSKYDDQLADLYNQITQRKPFEYSTDDDMLYQQYLQKYTQQGQQAMRDTMGQAAALTGGYGSSYGQAVGQQQYDAYLQQLNDIIPALQQAALERYNAEGDRLNQQYGMLSDMDDRARAEFQMNYGINADAYERLMSEAALRGAAGDFGGYEDIFGADSAERMAALFNLQTLGPYIESGGYLMPGMQQLLAPLLGSAGINMNNLMGSSGGDDPWGYGGSGWNGGDFYLENGIDPNYPGQTLTREELAAAGLGTR